jgi:hypothetical protein
LLIIDYGTHCFFPRRLAYRNDYCLTCDGVSIAVDVETFDWCHIFWIPLIPLGRRRRWLCNLCGSAPHERVASGRGFKMFTAVAFGLFALFAWVGLVATIVSSGFAAPELGFIAGMGAVMTAACVASALWSRTKPTTNLRSVLANVHQLPTDVCVFCRRRLDSNRYCSHCSMHRTEPTNNRH